MGSPSPVEIRLFDFEENESVGLENYIDNGEKEEGDEGRSRIQDLL